MLLVKILKFSLSLFFLKIGLNILMFGYLLEREHPLQDYKSNITRNSKNMDFSKEIVRWFLDKTLTFSLSFFFFKVGLKSRPGCGKKSNIFSQ